MRWIVATAVVVALAMALTGPVLAQELRVLENVDARGSQTVRTPPSTITQVVPTSSPFQTTKLDDRGVR